MRFYKWDYTKDEATEFERLGDCNGCGACCKAVIAFVVSGRVKDKDARNLGDSTDGEGIWAEVQKDKKRRYFQVTSVQETDKVNCSKLGENNQCTVHSGKPVLCEVWPVIPEQVTPFPECSYSFKEVRKWTISTQTMIEAVEVETA